MEPSHPAESNVWYVAIGVTLIAFIFFTVIGDSKLLFLLRFIACALHRRRHRRIGGRCPVEARLLGGGASASLGGLSTSSLVLSVTFGEPG
jgi:hypothetical protein